VNGGGQNLLHVPLMLLLGRADHYDIVQVDKHG
jgi:hypothetical protein